MILGASSTLAFLWSWPQILPSARCENWGNVLKLRWHRHPFLCTCTQKHCHNLHGYILSADGQHLVTLSGYRFRDSGWAARCYAWQRMITELKDSQGNKTCTLLCCSLICLVKWYGYCRSWSWPQPSHLTKKILFLSWCGRSWLNKVMTSGAFIVIGKNLRVGYRKLVWSQRINAIQILKMRKCDSPAFIAIPYLTPIERHEEYTASEFTFVSVGTCIGVQWTIKAFNSKM